MNFKAKSHFALQAENAQILLVMEGQITLMAENERLTLKQGESAFITAKTAYEIDGNRSGFAVLATLP